MKGHARFQWEIIAIRKNTWTTFKNLLLIWQIWANISTNLLLRILGFFVCLGFVVAFLIFFSLTWIRHHYRIVANHVQNVRSSPSLGGSYAESVTVAWDDAITGEGLHLFLPTLYTWHSWPWAVRILFLVWHTYCDTEIRLGLSRIRGWREFKFV